ncbi:murein hydrolase activator EnvC family protein [Aestuariivirga sp. YIM B02566]|uniref:Peptidoglycan DD-metalloendopeptidase family protein n=1 Tax=Taklimakanibacter albus TaxID=2800327 RepID=A0ACC5R2P1_9HYPH|nr:peptidoglycan DD-metalloendopeptidase family protein [Aestuariivirga sp. YIM B02566]MBK1866930.1 peptidoglycan DD-metalloendopeptidase family protein [Aestuariivirga sp. YIM B02566]
MFPRFEHRSTKLSAASLGALLLLSSPSPLLAETQDAPPAQITFAWPIGGLAELGFGQPDGAGGRLQGILFGVRKDFTLRAAADGTALYAGPFRSYGSLLILDHGCGLNSILAGAQQLSVTIGQKVRRGEPVGSAATSTQNEVKIYFELRRNGIAIAPYLVMPPQGATTPRTVRCTGVKTDEAPVDPQTDQPAAETAPAPPEPASAPSAGKIVWTGKWPWPARGEILRAFKVDGNDGINIAVPEGTNVKAVENGIVIYAGDGLKDFGNTVLVRHEGGLVTVYGHLSELKKKRGENVRRGDVIGKSGKTGVAREPQLHFEVRKKSAPVDPAEYLRAP